MTILFPNELWPTPSFEHLTLCQKTRLATYLYVKNTQCLTYKEYLRDSHKKIKTGPTSFDLCVTLYAMFLTQQVNFSGP